MTCASCSDGCVSFGKLQQFRLIESILSATNAPHGMFKGQRGWMTGSSGLRERERRDRRERERRERGERESEREKAYIAFLRRARLWNSNRASVGWCLQTTGEKKIWILWWNLFECYRQKSNSLMEMPNVSPWKQWKWVSNFTRVSCRMWPDLPRDQSLNQKSEIWGWRSKYLFYFTLFYILFYRSIVVLLFSCIMDCIIDASFGYVNNSIN